jgi:hypothetical protein
VAIQASRSTAGPTFDRGAACPCGLGGDHSGELFQLRTGDNFEGVWDVEEPRQPMGALRERIPLAPFGPVEFHELGRAVRGTIDVHNLVTEPEIERLQALFQ